MINIPMRDMLLAFLLFSSGANAQILVLDDLHRAVRLPAPAQRIVTLSPHATEMLIALNGEKKIIAAASFFDYPPSLDEIPKISTFGSLDREVILSYKPDLIIAWASGTRPGDLQWLKASAIPVFMSEPGAMSSIATTLEKLGVLIGGAEEGKLAANTFTKRITDACRQQHGTVIQTAYYEIWHNPPMTIGGKHWLNEVLQLAQLHNIFASVQRAVFSVSAEDLLANPAQVIVTSQPEAKHSTTGARILLASPTLGRPGPRIAEGLENLCKQLQETR